jgi:hypothetical protein
VGVADATGAVLGLRVVCTGPYWGERSPPTSLVGLFVANALVTGLTTGDLVGLLAASSAGEPEPEPVRLYLYAYEGASMQSARLWRFPNSNHYLRVRVGEWALFVTCADERMQGWTEYEPLDVVLFAALDCTSSYARGWT